MVLGLDNIGTTCYPADWRLGNDRLIRCHTNVTFLRRAGRRLEPLACPPFLWLVPRPRQSVHFANENPANSMKTIGQKNSNRYTLQPVKDCSSLRPQRLCGGFSVSNRNQNGFSGWPIPTVKTG